MVIIGGKSCCVNICLRYVVDAISFARVHNPTFYRGIIGLASLIKWKLESLEIVWEVDVYIYMAGPLNYAK